MMIYLLLIIYTLGSIKLHIWSILISAFCGFLLGFILIWLTLTIHQHMGFPASLFTHLLGKSCVITLATLDLHGVILNKFICLLYVAVNENIIWSIFEMVIWRMTHLQIILPRYFRNISLRWHNHLDIRSWNVFLSIIVLLLLSFYLLLFPYLVLLNRLFAKGNKMTILSIFFLFFFFVPSINIHIISNIVINSTILT